MLLNCGSPVKRNLQTLWPHLPNLQWLHSTAAGVEHILFPDLVDGPVTLTNAKVWVQCIHASGICQQTLVHLAVGTPGPFTCPMSTSTFRRLSCDDSVDCACKCSRNDGHAHPHQWWWCENAQGNFSHSLAEYTLAACNWFAKDLPRLRAQQKAKEWIPFDVEELRCVLWYFKCIAYMCANL